ncbi:MAG: tripartite tricarboxylate transporter substrate binding protein [Rhodospirillaceae bacterium]
MTGRQFMVAALLACSAAGALADEFPMKPVRLVVNFPAGGPSDPIARALAQKATELWGQQTIVDFRGGAAGNIGADHVAKSLPDGYTLLFMSGSFLTNPALSTKLPFDPIKDFTPITPAAVGGMILVANPALPAKSVKDIIALARRHPGKLTFASSGTGGSLHLNAELFKLMTGIDMLHVPYKGAGPAMIEVVAGQVDMMFIALPPTLPHIRNGKLRAVAVGSARRSPALPDVPTVAESGVPGYDVNSHFGVLAPAGVPAPAVSRLNATLVQALKSAETRERYAVLGVEPISSSPAEYSRYIEYEISKWRKVVKSAGLTPGA